MAETVVEMLERRIEARNEALDRLYMELKEKEAELRSYKDALALLKAYPPKPSDIVPVASVFDESRFVPPLL